MIAESKWMSTEWSLYQKVWMTGFVLKKKKPVTTTELLTTCCSRTHLSSSKPQTTTDFMQQEDRKWRHMYFDAIVQLYGVKLHDGNFKSVLFLPWTTLDRRSLQSGNTPTAIVSNYAPIQLPRHKNGLVPNFNASPIFLASSTTKRYPIYSTSSFQIRWIGYPCIKRMI